MDNKKEKIFYLAIAEDVIDIQWIATEEEWDKKFISKPEKIIYNFKEKISEFKGAVCVVQKPSTRIVVKVFKPQTIWDLEDLFAMFRGMERVIIFKGDVEAPIGASCYHDGPHPVGLYFSEEF